MELLYQEQQKKPILRKGYLWASFFFCILGGALALYATNLTFKLGLYGLADPGGCSFNDWISCDAVLSTTFAKMFGVPVAWWGFLFYLWTALAIITAVISRDINRGVAASEAALFLTLGAILFTFYKASQLISMQMLCPVCVGMYIANFAIFLFLVPALGQSYIKTGSFLLNYFKSIFKRQPESKKSPHPIRFGIFAIWVFGMGYLGIKYYEQSTIEPSAINIRQAVDKHFEQPPIDIKTDSGAAFTGNPESGVTIVEFSDFECPACRILASNMRTVLLEYRNQVCLYFINYPLDSSINKNVKRRIHDNAGVAAFAGICAQEQGDFWGYHDELFSDQKNINREFLLELAKKNGWDEDKFSACMDAEETFGRVLKELEMGRNAHITGTPRLFINGRTVKYWNNTEFLRAVIEEELMRR